MFNANNSQYFFSESKVYQNFNSRISGVVFIRSFKKVEKFCTHIYCFKILTVKRCLFPFNCVKFVRYSSIPILRLIYHVSFCLYPFTGLYTDVQPPQPVRRLQLASCMHLLNSTRSRHGQQQCGIRLVVFNSILIYIMAPDLKFYFVGEEHSE